MAGGHVVSGTLDPFAVDEDRWLEALVREWGAAFLISVNSGRWYGVRRDGSGDAIIAGTPGELNAALHAAWLRSAR